MPIIVANEVTFSTSPRCPSCGVGIVPYGLDEPFAVDNAGRLYCRVHGADVEPSYPERLAAYKAGLRERRLAALDRLEHDAGAPGE